MDPTLTADDLWPLVQKLSPEQRLQLARRAMRSAAGELTDAEEYAAMPVTEDEFGGDDATSGWEAEGWEEFHEAS